MADLPIGEAGLLQPSHQSPTKRPSPGPSGFSSVRSLMNHCWEGPHGQTLVPEGVTYMPRATAVDLLGCPAFRLSCFIPPTLTLQMTGALVAWHGQTESNW